MRIGDIELTQGRFVIIIAAIAAAAVFLIYMIFYAPLVREFRAKHLECRSCENQAVEAHNIVDSAGRVYGDKTLMSEKDVSAAIEELTKHGKMMDINFISIRPQEAVPDAGSQYKILPVEMKVEARNRQFSEFVGSLDEMSKGLIAVKSFDISPNWEDRSMLRATLVVNFYLSAGEDEQ